MFTAMSSFARAAGPTRGYEALRSPIRHQLMPAACLLPCAQECVGSELTGLPLIFLPMCL